jgi:Cu/Ag efflux protein CusF
MNTEPEKTNEQLRQENEELRQQNQQLIATVNRATEQLKQYDEWAKKVTANYKKLREKVSRLE